MNQRLDLSKNGSVDGIGYLGVLHITIIDIHPEAFIVLLEHLLRASVFLCDFVDHECQCLDKHIFLLIKMCF